MRRHCSSSELVDLRGKIDATGNHYEVYDDPKVPGQYRIEGYGSFTKDDAVAKLNELLSWWQRPHRTPLPGFI